MRNILVTVILVLSLLISAVAQAKEVAVGEAAPDFHLPIYNQQNFLRLSDYKGKIVLLGFVDTCEPCRIQAQTLEEVRAHYGDKIAVIGIVYEDYNGTKQLVDMLNPKPKYPLALDPKQTMAASYGLWGDPQVAIIDKKGKIVYKNYITPADKLIQEIDKIR
jgi:peroxiredoxin